MIYFAPMEGITDAVYRRIHHQLFNSTAKYFIPFISPTQDKRLPSREMRSIAPEYNQGVPAVPQILTKDADLFLWLAGQLQQMGYHEVNLNLGCPSGTVTAKGKGAGMLLDLDALEQFLETIYSACPLPVSIKTRIGFSSLDEWEALFRLLDQFPVSELIVHPRTRQEFYRGDIHLDIYREITAMMHCPVVFNGNLFCITDIDAFRADHISADALMIGRGLVSNPALARQAQGGAPLQASEIASFHDALYRTYTEMYPERIVLGKMREVTKYLAGCFTDTKKPLKAIFKAHHPAEYLDGVHMLLQREMKESPGYEPASPSQTWP